MTRLPNVALALDAELVLDLDSERRLAASAVEFALDPEAIAPLGAVCRFDVDGVAHRAVMTEKGMAVEVA